MNKILLTGLALLANCSANATDLTPLAKEIISQDGGSISWYSNDSRGYISADLISDSYNLTTSIEDDFTYLHFRDVGSNGLGPGDTVLLRHIYSDGTTIVINLSCLDEGYLIACNAKSSTHKSVSKSVTTDTLPWFAREKTFNRTSAKGLSLVELYRNSILNDTFGSAHTDLSIVSFDEKLAGTTIKDVFIRDKKHVDAFLEGKFLKSMWAFRGEVKKFDKYVKLPSYY